ncbi:hypothetical protein NBRC116583_31950 [Arenicella sp. 4NH20-0111]|uniref:thrombospondin type 3 repeat-containing protein n=1 Tax=Arenicella sp. 4NH20-0111 TaxID=3127648 RepID=UPI0031052631
MVGLNSKNSIAFLILFVPVSSFAQLASFIAAKGYVDETCPIAWEAPLASIAIQPGVEMWQSNLGDKARYIRFSSPGVSPSDSDVGRILQIKPYRDSESITACNSIRSNFFGVVRLQALAMTGFDHTVIRDEDQDGIYDADDICHGTILGDAIDIHGCSTSQIAANDADNDGVHDLLDKCPGTVVGQTPNSDGCAAIQLDADLDGILDVDDSYPHQSALMCTP